DRGSEAAPRAHERSGREDRLAGRLRGSGLLPAPVQAADRDDAGPLSAAVSNPGARHVPGIGPGVEAQTRGGRPRRGPREGGAPVTTSARLAEGSNAYSRSTPRAVGAVAGSCGRSPGPMSGE